MDEITRSLSALRPRRVLDLATGSGSFALRLAAELGSYGELVAVDSQAKAVAAAAKNLAGLPKAHVLKADAAALPLPDGSFDLVAMSNSLHHVEEPGKALAEALRVLEPGGGLAIYEMHRDAPDEASLSHVLLHHWWAKIDREAGVSHRETYGRDGLKRLLAGLGLEDETWLELPGQEEAFDPGLLGEIQEAIDSYLARIPGDSPRRAELAAEGEGLRLRVAEVGFRSAPSLFFTGRKRRA